ncbi:phenylalanine--tRNA ligase subunit beta [Candidatus Magnetomonas plexicatena]|uniref:phenylalanine--tRNA ligase subunit beta n=1 Tax=Candidatus Magnetomonas plexicatena TaxID=2552947 RepID=UPI001C7738BE|nr:phenylalanine--tRNA ligase subunit beta [Nitrospirales bacterium LBB_01]
MLLPIEWLADFIEIVEPTDKLSAMFTMAGLEVEAVYGQGLDTVLEINVTPNRGDCLSILGLARELSAITGRPIKLKNIDNTVADKSEEISIEIADTDLCKRYSGKIIRRVKVTQSPDWLTKRLQAVGQLRPINNIVDITNYVLFELGQPLHAFDLNKLRGNAIRVKRADRDVKVKSLDGIDRVVSVDSLLIWDGVRPVAIAGVMGAENSEVTPDTTDIFLESAWFLPESVRKTSKVLGLRSESSYRFERATDIDGTLRALNRAAELIVELCGSATPSIDIYPQRYEPIKIVLKNENVKKLLGIDISDDTVRSILERLGFIVSGDNGVFSVSVPSHRTDIELEADLIEEITRIHGYNNIPSVMPRACVSAKINKHKEILLRPLGGHLRQAGFTETINYSFMPLDALDTFLIPDGDERRKTVEVLNPLSKEQSVLRTFLLPALIENLKLNLNTGQKEIHLYEAGTVFINEGNTLPTEHFKLSMVSYNGTAKKLWQSEHPIFYKLRGIIDAMKESLWQTDNRDSEDGWKLIYKEFLSAQPSDPFLSNNNACAIQIERRNEKPILIGYMGLLSPEFLSKLGLEIQGTDVGVVELSLDAVFKTEQHSLRYRPFPKYPPILRDVAIVVDLGFASADMVKLIREFDRNLIESVEIFDVYTGKSVGESKKSIACHIVYRSAERTLVDDEIDDLHGRMVSHLLKETGGALRS